MKHLFETSSEEETQPDPLTQEPFPELQAGLNQQMEADPQAYAQKISALLSTKPKSESSSSQELSKRFGPGLLKDLQVNHPDLTAEDVLDEINAHGL